MKPRIMWAVYGSKAAKRPCGLFHSKWKAKEAVDSLWSHRKPIIKRVAVNFPEAHQITVTHHEYRVYHTEEIPSLSKEEYDHYMNLPDKDE